MVHRYWDADTVGLRVCQGVSNHEPVVEDVVVCQRSPLWTACCTTRELNVDWVKSTQGSGNLCTRRAVSHWAYLLSAAAHGKSRMRTWSRAATSSGEMLCRLSSSKLCIRVRRDRRQLRTAGTFCGERGHTTRALQLEVPA